jgi:hypothetical protein
MTENICPSCKRQFSEDLKGGRCPSCEAHLLYWRKLNAFVEMTELREIYIPEELLPRENMPGGGMRGPSVNPSSLIYDEINSEIGEAHGEPTA